MQKRIKARANSEHGKLGATRTKKAKEKPSLVYARGNECFWINNGMILSSLADLSKALKGMNNEVFSHHVNKEKNDFASWVEAILKDSECAKSLRRAKTPKSAYTAVARHLRKYV